MLTALGLSLANLSEANLSGANLKGADLRRALFEDANLSGANLQRADLRGTDFTDAELKGFKPFLAKTDDSTSEAIRIGSKIPEHVCATLGKTGYHESFGVLAPLLAEETTREALRSHRPVMVRLSF